MYLIDALGFLEISTAHYIEYHSSSHQINIFSEGTDLKTYPGGLLPDFAPTSLVLFIYFYVLF